MTHPMAMLSCMDRRNVSLSLSPWFLPFWQEYAAQVESERPPQPSLHQRSDLISEFLKEVVDAIHYRFLHPGKVHENGIKMA